MTFLNSSFLWFLPAAGLPVLIHFIFLNRSRNISFSSIFLLRQVYLKNLPRSRIEQWILLALRCFALAVLILAFCRPVIYSSLAGRIFTGSMSGPALKIVMLADVSYSMRCRSQGEERYKLAVQAASAVLRRLKPADKVALGFFSDRPEGVGLEWTSDFQRVEKALEISGPGFRGTDYNLALKEAFKFLASSKEDGNKIILLISDGAKHGLKNLSDISSLPFYDKKVLLAGTFFGENRENAWIESFSPQGTGFFDAVKSAEGRGGGMTAEAGLKISGGSRYSWPVRLLPRGGAAVERRVDTFDGKTTGVVWNMAGPVRNFSGKVEMKEDSLHEDDVYFFSLDFPDTVKTLCAYSDPAFMDAGRGGFFIKKIFGHGGGSLLPFTCDYALLSRLGEIKLGGYSAVIISGFSRLSGECGNILRDYVMGGGGLWIIPDPSLESGGLSALEAVMPAEINGLVEKNVKIEPADIEPDPGSKEKKGFKWRDFELDRLGVKKFFALSPKKDAQIKWRFTNGREKWPALVGRNAGRGRVLCWAASLEPSWTAVAVKPLFISWMERALTWVSNTGRETAVNQFKIGGVFERKWPNPNLAPRRLRIDGPDGMSSIIAVSQGTALFDGTAAPGLYSWRGEGTSEEGVFAVNPDTESGESDLTEELSPPWKKIKISEAGEGFMTAVHGAGAGPVFFLFALLALLAETILSKRIV